MEQLEAEIGAKGELKFLKLLTLQDVFEDCRGGFESELFGVECEAELGQQLQLLDGCAEMDIIIVLDEGVFQMGLERFELDELRKNRGELLKLDALKIAVEQVEPQVGEGLEFSKSLANGVDLAGREHLQLKSELHINEVAQLRY